MFAIDTQSAPRKPRHEDGSDPRRQPRAGADDRGTPDRGRERPDRRIADQRDEAPQPPAAGQLGLAAALADPIGYAPGFLRRRFLSIVGLGLTGLAIGVALALTTHDRFAATAQLLIDPRDLRVLQNDISPQSVGGDVTTAYLESQARVISSDSVKRKVIEKLDLSNDPDFGTPGGGLGARFGLGRGGAEARRDPVLVALAAMDKQVLVRRGDRTFVIDITAISGDGAKSARIANAMAETYLEDQASVRSDSAQRATNALSSRLTELRERVRVAEGKVEAYRAANNLVGAGGKLVTEEQLAVSNTQLAQARARTADAQAKYDQVRVVRPTSIEAGATPEALNSASLAALRGQLGAALTREADALVLYGRQHPQLVSAQAQVRDSRRQIAEELARIVQASRAELDRARAAETAISAQVERLKRDTLSTGQAAVQLRELEREADAHRQVYQAFLLRARETSEQTGLDTTNARVITEAVQPLEKLGPNRKLHAMIGLVAGLMAGLAVAVMRDMLAGRKAAMAGGASLPAAAPQPRGARAGAPLPGESRADAERQKTVRPQRQKSFQSATASTSAAPHSRPAGAGTSSAGRWRGARVAPVLAEEAAPPVAEGPVHVTLPAAMPGLRKRETSAFHGAAFATDAWDEPRSALAAAIGEVRDRLAIEEVPGANRKVVVLGLSPGAGASLVALNLTLAAAREKATPILIDLAAGPASLSASFAPDADIGAEQVISGSAGLIRAALQDDETGAFFLPRPAAAERHRAPAAERLKTGLLDQTRRFEAVVIDGGSLADGPLPYMLAELADDIVIVAPEWMEADQALALAERSLGPDARKLRAAVMNEGAAR